MKLLQGMPLAGRNKRLLPERHQAAGRRHARASAYQDRNELRRALEWRKGGAFSAFSILQMVSAAEHALHQTILLDQRKSQRPPDQQARGPAVVSKGTGGRRAAWLAVASMRSGERGGVDA